MLYKPSVLASDFRNKIGQFVGTKNHYANIFREWVKPYDPQSILQLSQRAQLGGLAAEWKTLTAGQILSWNDFSKLYPFKNPLGQEYFLTGEALFIKLNLNALSAGVVGTLEDPYNTPAQSIAGGFTVRIVTTPGTNDIKLDFPSPITSDSILIMESCGVVSNGQSYYKGYKKFVNLDHTFISGDSIMTEYIASIGTMPTTGQKVAFRARFVSITSGWGSNYAKTTAIGTV